MQTSEQWLKGSLNRLQYLAKQEDSSISDTSGKRWASGPISTHQGSKHLKFYFFLLVWPRFNQYTGFVSLGFLTTQVPYKMLEPQSDLFTIVRWRCFFLTLLVNHINTQNNFLKKQFRFDFFALQSIQSCGLIVHDQMTELILAERRQNRFQKTLLYYYHCCRWRCGNNRDISTKQLQYDFLPTVVCRLVFP